MVKLELKRVSGVVGIYGQNHDQLPVRMCLLHPTAYYSFAAANKAASGNLVVSDMFRSPESSLEAVAAGKGAQPPGYSAHNFGLAVDIAIDQTLNRMQNHYADLLVHMANYGWYCYRRDGLRGAESWHFNYLGDQAGEILPQLTLGKWARAAETVIQAHYGAQLVLSPAGIQGCLKQLRMYGGAVDGQLGPLSKRALEVFGRAWQCNTDPENEKLQRTLAIVAAEQQIEE